MFAGAIPQIKDALPVRPAVPICPGGKGEIRAVPQLGRQLQVGITAIEAQGLPGPPWSENRPPYQRGIIPIARGIAGRSIKQKRGGRAAPAVRQLLHVIHRRNVITVNCARPGERAIVPHHPADILHPVVDRITFHEGRIVQHLDHLRHGGLLLRLGGVRIGGPVGPVVELGHPERTFGAVINPFEKVVELGRRPIRIGRIPITAVIMHRHKIHPQSRGITLIDKRIQPAQPAIGDGRRPHPQSGRQQIRPGIHRIPHAQIGLIHVIRFVVSQQVIGAPGFPILIQARPPAGLADRHILHIAGGIPIQIPIVIPLNAEVLPGVAGEALLAHPAPREDADKPDRVIQIGRQHAHFDIALLRHINLAGAGAIFLRGKSGHVTALQPEGGNRLLQRPQADVVVLDVVLQPFGGPGKIGPIKHLQRGKVRRVRDDHRPLQILGHPDIAVHHCRHPIDPHPAKEGGNHLGRQNVIHEEPGIRRGQVDDAAGDRIAGSRDMQFRRARNRCGRVHQRGHPDHVGLHIQSLGSGRKRETACQRQKQGRKREAPGTEHGEGERGNRRGEFNPMAGLPCKPLLIHFRASKNTNSTPPPGPGEVHRGARDQKKNGGFLKSPGPWPVTPGMAVVSPGPAGAAEALP